MVNLSERDDMLCIMAAKAKPKKQDDNQQAAGRVRKVTGFKRARGFTRTAAATVDSCGNSRVTRAD
jgi:hypothetical protein